MADRKMNWGSWNRKLGVQGCDMGTASTRIIQTVGSPDCAGAMQVTNPAPERPPVGLSVILMCLLFCLLPFTIKAQDTLKVPPIRDWVFYTPDSIRIHPEPWPDSELVAYVKHLVDSSLAQLGHWQAHERIYVGPRAAPDALRMPSDSCVTGYECWRDTTWVFVKGPKP